METRIKNIFSKTQIDFEISKGQPRSTRYDFSIRTTAPPGGWGILNKCLYGVAPSQIKVQPFPFYVPFFTKKVPLSYTVFYCQMVPLSHTFFRTFHPFYCCKCNIFDFK